MNSFTHFTYLKLAMIILVVWIGLFSPPPAMSCPACKLSVPSEDGQLTSPDNNADALARATSTGRGYNLSIVIMMVMPFLIMGTFGGVLFFINRKSSATNHVQVPSN